MLNGRRKGIKVKMHTYDCCFLIKVLGIIIATAIGLAIILNLRD